MKIDLSGIWTYQVEGGETGSVRVPSAYDFTGSVTFKRTFEVNSHLLDKYQFHLVMLGANYSTGIWVNNDFILNHIGGYTSFVASIPSSTMQVGSENTIKVEIDNRLDATKSIPLRSQVWGWRNYGGILRDVYVLGTPRLYIADAVTTTEVDPDFMRAKLKINPSVEGTLPQTTDSLAPRYQVYAEVFEKNSGLLVGTTTSSPLLLTGKEWRAGTVECVLNGPRLWTPETPELYSVRTYLVNAATGTRIDEYHQNIGVRAFELRGDQIVLNGRTLMLKGVIWNEYHAQFGNALSHAQMEKDIIAIRGLGANALRFANHPPHPYMLNLCDRYGMIALVELPIKNVPAKILVDENYIELATTMMREMIVRDRNHPSVFAWGLGDEFESNNPLARKFVEPLASAARKLDGRPLYYGTRFLTNDACTDLVDIAALAVLQRDTKEFRKILETWKTAHPGKPLLVAKMGCEVQPSNTNGYSDPLSVEAQARFYIQHIEAAKSANCGGVFVWSFNDWKGDRPALTVNSGDPWLHTLGLVTASSEHRLAYDAVRSTFNGERFSALPIGSSSSAAPIVYVLAGLMTLISTAYVYNANRRFRESLNRSMVNSYNFFSDVRDQRIVTVVHSTLLGIVISIATAIVLSSLLYRFRSSIALDNFLSYILITDGIKEFVVKLILNPPMFIVVCSGVIFLKLLLITGLVWLMAPVFKARIFPFHAYAITMWSTPPLLILVPIGMILYRLMDAPIYVVPVVLFCAFLGGWVFIRLLKGISIILDIYPVKVYSIGVVLLVALLAGAYFYLDYTQSASVYIGPLLSEILNRAQ